MLRAQRPELCIQLYKDMNMWKDALRVAKEYMPQLVVRKAMISHDKAIKEEGIKHRIRKIEREREY